MFFSGKAGRKSLSTAKADGHYFHKRSEHLPWDCRFTWYRFAILVESIDPGFAYWSRASGELIAGKPVPALVYRRHAHVINLFVLPASRGDLATTITRNGYTLRHWDEGDLGFWAVSDAAPSELSEFERVFHAATGG